MARIYTFPPQDKSEKLEQKLEHPVNVLCDNIPHGIERINKVMKKKNLDQVQIREELLKPEKPKADSKEDKPVV